MLQGNNSSHIAIYQRYNFTWFTHRATSIGKPENRIALATMSNNKRDTGATPTYKLENMIPLSTMRLLQQDRYNIISLRETVHTHQQLL